MNFAPREVSGQASTRYDSVLVESNDSIDMDSIYYSVEDSSDSAYYSVGDSSLRSAGDVETRHASSLHPKSLHSVQA